MAVVGAALAASSPAHAGTTIPNPGDERLGSAGGLTYRADSETFNPANNDFANALVGCGSAGRHVLGGGGRGGGAAAARSLGSTLPRDSGVEPEDTLPDDGWEVGGRGTPGARLTAYVVCSREPLSSIRYRRAEPPNTGTNARFGEVGCAGERWHATGGGGIVSPSDGYLNSSAPSDAADPNPAPDDGWFLAFYDPFGGPGGADVSVVCRRGRGVAYRDGVRGRIGVGDAGKVRVSCPRRSHVVGGGAELNGAVVDGRLLDSYPFDSRADSDAVPDDGWAGRGLNVGGSARRLTVHAICLR